MDAGVVQSPNMPIHIMTQEAEDLSHCASQDSEALGAAGLDLQMIEALQPASGALRYAEGEWNKVRSSRADSQQRWNDESPAAFGLRDRIVHAYLFAYRNRPDVLSRVRAMAEGSTSSDMIQDLVNYSALGKEHPEELDKINFDKTLLETAAATADRMADLLGEANADSALEKSARDIRDRAFTRLRQLMTEIRDYGKYVFYRNDDRCYCYASKYLRRFNQAASRSKKEQNAEVPVEEPVSA